MAVVCYWLAYVAVWISLCSLRLDSSAMRTAPFAQFVTGMGLTALLASLASVLVAAIACRACRGHVLSPVERRRVLRAIIGFKLALASWLAWAWIYIGESWPVACALLAGGFVVMAIADARLVVLVERAVQRTTKAS